MTRRYVEKKKLSGTKMDNTEGKIGFEGEIRSLLVQSLSFKCLFDSWVEFREEV